MNWSALQQILRMGKDSYSELSSLSDFLLNLFFALESFKTLAKNPKSISRKDTNWKIDLI